VAARTLSRRHRLRRWVREGLRSTFVPPRDSPVWFGHRPDRWYQRPVVALIRWREQRAYQRLLGSQLIGLFDQRLWEGPQYGTLYIGRDEETGEVVGAYRE
jgi:hypothetical protein